MKEQVRQFIRESIERKKQGKPRLSDEEIKRLFAQDLKEMHRNKQESKWAR